MSLQNIGGMWDREIILATVSSTEVVCIRNNYGKIGKKKSSPDFVVIWGEIQSLLLLRSAELANSVSGRFLCNKCQKICQWKITLKLWGLQVCAKYTKGVIQAVDL